jgi:hypothetical protein
MISFWNKILDIREEAKLEEQLKSMPKDCRELYKKFIVLRKQTKTLRKELVNIGISN